MPGATRRVTPKGTPPPEHRPEPSRRYTPPAPHADEGPSPRWVPILMFALLGLGAAVIILNYLGVLPGATDNLWLVAGLLLVTGGFITATRLR